PGAIRRCADQVFIGSRRRGARRRPGDRGCSRDPPAQARPLPEACPDRAGEDDFCHQQFHVAAERSGRLTGRPDRFLALHFANEIWIRNIAEIMGHPGTDPAVYETVVEFARSIGMEPIELKKEQPGYVLNSLTVPFLFAALDLLVKDVADPATIDKTWRIATGAPAGPFQMLDVIGLNTVYNIAVASPDETVQAAAKYLKERYLDRGKLGQASGEGFYRYPVTA